MASRLRRSEYPARTVRYLVGGYPTLRYRRDTTPGWGLDLLCQLLDVQVAVDRLEPKEYQAVLLCGLIGLTEDEAGKLLGVSQQTISHRYRRGLEMLKALLNGDGE